jgi:uncharacterized protein (TIGR03083 family)
MTTTTPDAAPVAIEDIEPITPAVAHVLAAAEYTRLADLLDDLDRPEWVRMTDCPSWDVRSVAGHCIGMAADFTSLARLARRQARAVRAARRTGRQPVDEMTAQQVAEQSTLAPEELIARLRQVGPAAAMWRTEGPAVLRRLRVPQEVGGVIEKWPMSYLLDVILTRDPWMHRVDISRATGREMVLTPEHDGRLVTDVVAEWAHRHGRPFTLTLTGPIGATYVAGDAPGETITIDAVEFCRTVSGRATGSGLLTEEVPF